MAKYKVPTYIEMRLMDLFCNTGKEMYKREVSEELEGIYGESNIYKNIRNLEKKGFVKVTSKKLGRGPAKEYIRVNCDNCFWKYESQGACFKSRVEKLIKAIQSYLDDNTLIEKIKEFIGTMPQTPEYISKLGYILGLLIPLKSLRDDTIGYEIYQQLAPYFKV